MKAVFDTRFFISSLESKEPDFKKWSKAMLDALERQSNLGMVPSIVILELYKIQLEKFSKDVAELRVNSILRLGLELVNLDLSIAIEAAKLRCKYAELPTADAIIAATAINMSADFVLTDDKHINQIREVRTKWV